MAKKKEDLITNVDIDEDVDSLDQAQSRGMMGLMNVKPQHLGKLTEIEDDLELKQVSVIKSIAREFEIPLIKSFLHDFLELKISLKRQGRTEAKDVLSSSIRQKIQESMGSALGRVRGMMG